MPYGNPPDCRPKHRLSSVWLKFSPAFFKRRRGRGRGALSRKAPKVPEILLRKSFRPKTAKYPFRRLFWANSAKQICGGATRSLYFFLCAFFLQRKSGYGICTLFISTAFCRQPAVLPYGNPRSFEQTRLIGSKGKSSRGKSNFGPDFIRCRSPRRRQAAAEPSSR